MKPMFANLMLGLVWMAVTGDFTVLSFLLGFVLAFVVLALAGDTVGAGDYGRRVGAGFALAGFFAAELVRANLRLAGDVLTPGLEARPGIVRIDLEAESDVEILLLSLLVTLTPGSVVVEVTQDRSRMYVYDMYARDPERLRRHLKEVFERRVLAATRRPA